MKKLISLVFVVLFTLFGCSKSSTTYYDDPGITVTRDSDGKYQTQIFSMDTLMTLAAYGESAEEALVAAAKEIFAMERTLSVTDENSEVYAINHAPTFSATVSPVVAELCSYALELSENSGGAFDISVYPIVSAWGFTTGSYQLPTQETITESLKSVDWHNIDLNDDILTLSEGMAIDFGALAKGYASQRITKLFEEYQLTSAIVSLGGNVQTLGTKPDGTNWTIAIQNPIDANAYAAILNVSNTAVVTSGGYQRYFEENGTRYHHIIDPATGYPADSDLLSVTVICDDGTLADGLSTTLFVLGEDGAVDYWHQYGDFEMVLITNDDRILVSDGIADHFYVSDDSNYTVEVIQ